MEGEVVLRVWQVVEGPLPWCVQQKYNGLWAVGKTEANKEVLFFDKICNVAAINTGWSEGGERGRMCEHQPGHHCQCVGAGAEAALGDGEGALHKAAAWVAHGLQGDGQ